MRDVSGCTLGLSELLSVPLPPFAIECMPNAGALTLPNVNGEYEPSGLKVIAGRPEPAGNWITPSNDALVETTCGRMSSCGLSRLEPAPGAVLRTRPHD